MWWRQASQRSWRERSCWRRTQLPFRIPVLEDVVSKPQAMILSVNSHSSRTALTVSASTFPVEDSVLVMLRILFSGCWIRTTASLFTFPKPYKLGRSFPSKFIWPTSQVKFSLIVAATSFLAVARCRLAVDLLRDMLLMSPPPWLEMAANIHHREVSKYVLGQDATGTSINTYPYRH